MRPASSHSPRHIAHRETVDVAKSGAEEGPSERCSAERSPGLSASTESACDRPTREDAGQRASGEKRRPTPDRALLLSLRRACTSVGVGLGGAQVYNRYRDRSSVHVPPKSRSRTNADGQPRSRSLGDRRNADLPHLGVRTLHLPLSAGHVKMKSLRIGRLWVEWTVARACPLGRRDTRRRPTAPPDADVDVVCDTTAVGPSCITMRMRI